jgi:hypothetical protein
VALDPGAALDGIGSADRRRPFEMDLLLFFGVFIFAFLGIVAVSAISLSFWSVAFSSFRVVRPTIKVGIFEVT